MPHRINLTAAWRVERLPGAALWSRPFGRPTGLVAGDRVTLVFTGLDPAATVDLGGEPLVGPHHTEQPGGDAAATVYDVTGRLADRNVIRLTVADDGTAGPPFVAAALVIDPATR